MSFQMGEELNCWEVQNFVQGIHYNMEDFEEGNLRERIEEFDNYKLKEININQVGRGDYYVDEETVEEFAEKNIQTMPPIVIGHKYGELYDVVDGNHRVETIVSKGLTTILAFIPVER